MINVGFIGAGNMGSAIMKGIVSSDMSKEISLFAYDKFEAALDKARAMGVTGTAAAADVVKQCKYVFFAIKPQQLDEVRDEVANDVTADTVIVSILAGVTDEYYARRTVPGAKVVLVMPNTPFLLGYGLAVVGMYYVIGTPHDMRFLCIFPIEGSRSYVLICYAVTTGLLVSLGEMLLGTLTEKISGVVWWNYTWIPLHVTKYTSVPTSIGFAHFHGSVL